MSSTESILISSDGIKKSLKKYKSLNAIAEYVWNGFDANATKINIEIEINVFGKIESICISDNGAGINKEQLNQKFRPFFQSEKVYNPSDNHGKNGVGRLTFFTFATDAIWETVYKNEKGQQHYTISVNSNKLDQYMASEESDTIEQPGTTVSFYNIFDHDISITNITEFLAKEFCWFLELHKKDNYSILINSCQLDYSESIAIKECKSFIIEESNVSFEVTLICWNHKLSEYSKYYFIKSDGTELGKENTTYNNKGDNFYHSVFIKSSLFDNFDLSNVVYQIPLLEKTKNKKSKEYIFIMETVNKLLIDKRKPFLKEHVSKVIDSLDIISAFPNYNANNLIYMYKKDQIEDLITSLYIAQPKIFSNSMNKEQKKTFIRLLDLIMESGDVDSLFQILQEILDMDTFEREELAGMLKYTHMSNITKTIKLIKDRYQAVNDLRDLVFKEELDADEVHHVQKFIEQHYWLFGEQYNLVTAAEPNFVEALKRYLHYLHEEYSNVEVAHPDRLKQMDIFAVRQDLAHSTFNNIVVELKHPSIVLGEKQLSQVKKYMEVILSIDDFNASNMTWEFYLVGNRFNSYIEREILNNRQHGEPSLVFHVDNYKIYVKTWSEIFADFEMRYSHLNKVLNLQREKLQTKYRSADEVIENQSHNAAKMPPEMSIAK
jgi:hypothetical protein